MSVNALRLQQGMAGWPYPPRVRTILQGDSMAAQNTLVDSTDYSYRDKGFATWMQTLSNGCIYLPPENNFGVSGDTLAMILARMPTALAASGNVVVWTGGTNDLNAATTLAQMQATATAIADSIVAVGKISHGSTIPPRDFSTLNGQANLDKQLAYNSWWLTQTASNRIVTNVSSTWDSGDAHNNPKPGYVQSADLLHPTNLGAYWWGKPLCADAIANGYITGIPKPYPASFYPPAIRSANRYGNLYFDTSGNNLGLMQGTAGTFTNTTNFTHTGNVPSGWNIGISGAFTSSMTCAATFDPSVGQRRLILTVTVTAAGSTAIEQLRVIPRPSVYSGGVNPGSGIVAAGQTWEDDMQFEIIGTPVGLAGVDLVLVQTGPGAPKQVAQAMGYGADGSFLSEGCSGMLTAPRLTLASGITTLAPQFNIRYKGNANTTSFQIAIWNKQLWNAPA